MTGVEKLLLLLFVPMALAAAIGIYQFAHESRFKVGLSASDASTEWAIDTTSTSTMIVFINAEGETQAFSIPNLPANFVTQTMVIKLAPQDPSPK